MTACSEMRVRLALAMLLAAGCGGDDMPPTPRLGRAPADAGAPQQPKKPPPIRGEFQARWHEHLPLPEEDVRDCVVTFSPAAPVSYRPTKFYYLYFADRRLLITPNYEVAYGVDGMVERVYTTMGGDEPNLYLTVMFDEHANLTSSKHYTAGTSVSKNEYDGPHLISVETSSEDGTHPFRDVYSYQDAENPDLWSSWERDVDADGTIDLTVRRVVEGDHQTFTWVERGGGIRSVSTQTFRDGRIAAIEQLGGGWTRPVAGQPTLRQTWEWDESGRLLSFRSSGNGGSDMIDPNPVDYVETFPPGCRILQERFPWAFHEPGPRSTGARNHPVFE